MPDRWDSFNLLEFNTVTYPEKFIKINKINVRYCKLDIYDIRLNISFYLFLSISAHLHCCESFAAVKTTAAAFDALHMHQT